MSSQARALLGSFALCLALLVPLGLSGESVDAGVSAALRASGRLSFFLFLLPLTASSLSRLFPHPATRWLMKRRSELGLVFAGAHFAHLVLILWLAAQPSTAFGPLVVAFGGLGMLALLVMTITSFPKVRRAVGPRRWSLLHRIGLHYLAFIFAFDWVTLFPKNPPLYGPLAALLAAAYVLRFIKRRK